MLALQSYGSEESDEETGGNSPPKPTAEEPENSEYSSKNLIKVCSIPTVLPPVSFLLYKLKETIKKVRLRRASYSFWPL